MKSVDPTAWAPTVTPELPPSTQTLQESLDRQDRMESSGRSEWRVAGLRCYELGLSLRGAPPPPLQPQLSPDPRTALLAELLAAAICHSTNWDRLRNSVGRAAQDPEWFEAERLGRLSFVEFRSAFGDGIAADSTLAARHRLFTETAGIVASGAPICLDEMLGRPLWLAGA